MKKIELAKLFHDTYERLAPKYGYETRKDTKEFDPNTPNGKLMIEVCNAVVQDIEKKAFSAGFSRGLQEK